MQRILALLTLTKWTRLTVAGCLLFLGCIINYDGVTGLHLSLGPDCTLKNLQYWVKQDGATAKAASPAPPPMTWSTSVQGLTQHFEQTSMRNPVNTADMGHIPDNATAEVSQITLKHDEISTEFYTGHVFPTYELVPTPSSRHQTTTESHWCPIQLDVKPRDCFLQHSQASHLGSSKFRNVGRDV